MPKNAKKKETWSKLKINVLRKLDWGTLYDFLSSVLSPSSVACWHTLGRDVAALFEGVMNLQVETLSVCF